MLMQPQRTWVVDPSSTAPVIDAKQNLLELGAILAMLRRRMVLIGVCAVILVALGVAYLATTRPMFTSTATVYLDLQNAQMARGEDTAVPVSYLGLDDATVNSQLAIIESERIATRVIRAMNLQNEPEFGRSQSLLGGYVRQAVGAIRSVLNLGGGAPPQLAEGDVPRGMLDSFLSRVKVELVDRTFVIAISFSSEDPERAAAIANAIANAYLEEKLDARYESMRRASTWLQDRLEELRAQAEASDRAVQEFKTANGIIDTNSGNGQTLTDTELATLSTQLADAQHETAQRQARYDQIESVIRSGDPDATVVDALGNAVITQLRQQYGDLSQREANISSRYGSDHEAAQRMRRDMEHLEGLMLDELRRIADVYRNDLEVAKGQQAEIEGRLALQTQRATEIARARVKLRELERVAQSDQNLYQSFLDRYNTAIQQQSFPITDARILTEASPPRDKSSPKTTLTLALAAAAGLGLGLAIALGRELADSAFRSPAQVERLLNVPCLGVLPKLSRTRAHFRRLRRGGGPGVRMLPNDLGVFQYAVKEPLSRFSETLRAVKLAADFTPSDRGVRVIGVVSSVPGEGKSTITMNIAQLFAAAGKSVLVIDADLRSPTLTRDVAPDSEAGLLEHLTSGASIAETIYADEAKPLRFLPASGKTRVPHTSDLIGSQRMAELIEAARQTYDYVILDLPPLAPVIDAKAVAPVVDGFVYVIEWGKTSVATVSEALHNAPIVHQKLIGSILNKADMNALRLYTKIDGKSDYYAYEKFGNYISSGA